MKDKYRWDNKSQAISYAIEGKIASLIKKSIDFMSSLTTLTFDWASLKRPMKSQNQNNSDFLIQVFKCGLTYCGALLELFINKVVLRLLCCWSGI